jgi:hypothetical protein
MRGGDDYNPSYLFWSDAGVDAMLDFLRVFSLARGSQTRRRQGRSAEKLVFSAR